jgi:hypothetical protein
MRGVTRVILDIRLFLDGFVAAAGLRLARVLRDPTTESEATE